MKSKSPLSELKVESLMVVDQAVEKLRDAILSGALAPNFKLGEVELAKAMAISRPTLREALRRLQGQQLVEFLPNKGACVAALEPEEISDLQDVWRLLTGEAIKRFAKRASQSQLLELQRRWEEVSAASGDALALLKATNRFFYVILEGSRSRTLATIVRHMAARINFLRAQSMSDPRRREAHVEELLQITRLLQKKDWSKARKLIEAHIDSVCIQARDYLEGKNMQAKSA